jgi:diguanylate cyclase (GGDEF)-like protein/PAS domain S-box-containing protein
VAAACGLFVIALANAVLLGWVVDVPVLKSVVPGYTTMKVNTALGFLLSGCALAYLSCSSPPRSQIIVARLCATVVAWLGLLTLGQYALGTDIGIDRWIYSEHPTAGKSAIPGRMAPLTALSFMLVSAALILASLKYAGLRAGSQLLALAVVLSALTVLIGYAYGVESLYTVTSFNAMALHTSLAFLVLACGTLMLSPDAAVLRALASDFSGGAMLRLLLVPVMFVPFMLGWIYLHIGAQAATETRFGFAILVVANTVLVAALMIRSAVKLNRADEDNRLSEAKLKEALASSSDAQLVVNNAGLVVLANTQAARLIGQGQRDLLGQSVENLLPKRSGDTAIHPVIGFFASPPPRAASTAAELDVARRDGAYLPVEITLSPLYKHDEVLVTCAIPRFVPTDGERPLSRPDTYPRARILLVEPDADEASRLRASLAGNDGESPVITTAASMEEADALMRESQFDLLLMDLGPPDSNGIAALGRLKQSHPEMPVVVLTAQYDVQVERQVLAEGAEDCVNRDLLGPWSLRRIVRRALEHKANMAALQDVERQSRFLLDSSPSVIYLTSLEARKRECRLVSRALADTFGYQPREMMSDPQFWFDHVHPDDRTRFLEEFATAEREGHGVFEYRFRTAGGDHRWIEDRLRVVHGPDGGRFAVGAWTDVTERRQAVMALKRTETEFRQLFESTPDGLLLVAADGTIARANTQADHIFAVPPGSLIGRGVESLIPTRLRSAHVRLREAYTSHPVSRSMGSRKQLLALRGDGSEFPIDASLSPISIDEKRLVLCAIRDASESVRLQSEHERYGRMLDQSVNEIYIFDAKTLRFAGVNNGACRNLDYTREELTNLTPLDLKPEFSRPQFEKLIAPLRGTDGKQIVFETFHRRKDGSTYPVEVHLQHFQDSVSGMFVAFILDITERRAAEARLRESARQMSTILENVPGAVYRCLNDPDWTMTAVSMGMQALTGYTPAQFLSREVMYASIMHPDDRAGVWDAVQSALRAGTPFEFEYRIITADGKQKYVREHGCGVPAEDGTLAALEGFIWDITDRKEKEQSLARLNHMYVFLKEINNATSRIHELTALFWETCRIAVEHGDMAAAWIAYCRQNTSTMVPVAHYGEGSEMLIRDRHELMTEGPDSPCLAEQAIQDRKVVICNDLAAVPERQPELAAAVRLGFRSAAAIPLHVAGQCVGVFMLYSLVPDFFEEGEQRLLRELARDLGFALDYIEKEQRARYLTHFDVLTGLRNRDMFLLDLSRLIRGQIPSQGIALLVFDLERFTQVNESMGRHFGDLLLQQVAQRLRDGLAEGAAAARLGEDKFAVAHPGVQHEQDAARVVEELSVAVFGRPFHLNKTELRVSARFGVALFPDDGDTPDVLLRHAEAALRRAQYSGDRYLFFTAKMSERAAEKLSLENELRLALERGEFVLHYQPVVTAGDRRVLSVEALIRWNHPQRGLVPPMQFIPLLEETGLILNVGEWALSQAAADLRTWTAGGVPLTRIAVNVSPIQFRKSTFVTDALAAMSHGGAVTPLDLEITESAIMEDVEEHLEKLLALREAGCALIVDDFGTGYSSLSYLTRLPISALKIDRSFVVGMASTLQSRLIVSTVISLAHNLNLKVIAEGVDSDEQVDILRQLRCDSIQGFLVSTPIPAEQLVARLRSGELRKG